MLKDEHKDWKVKTVTSLPIAFIDFIQAIRWVISLRSDAHATCVNWGENFGGRH